jgi:hypothetical protein
VEDYRPMLEWRRRCRQCAWRLPEARGAPARPALGGEEANIQRWTTAGIPRRDCAKPAGSTHAAAAAFETTVADGLDE